VLFRSPVELLHELVCIGLYWLGIDEKVQSSIDAPTRLSGNLRNC